MDKRMKADIFKIKEGFDFVKEHRRILIDIGIEDYASYHQLDGIIRVALTNLGHTPEEAINIVNKYMGFAIIIGANLMREGKLEVKKPKKEGTTKTTTTSMIG